MNIEFFLLPYNDNFLVKYDYIVCIVYKNKIAIAIEKTTNYEYVELEKFKISKFYFFHFFKKYSNKTYMIYINVNYQKYNGIFLDFFFYYIDKTEKVKITQR